MAGIAPNPAATMSMLQILGLVATVLGIVTAVLNLVAFVREKDRSHLKAGLIVLALLALLGLLAAFPMLAPERAQALATRVPWLSSWLAPEGTPAPVTPRAEAAVVKGTFSIRIRRNVLGGIDAVPLEMHFANGSAGVARILSWKLNLQRTKTSLPETFEEVLETPVEVPAGGTARVDLELKGAAREAWLAREKESDRGPMQMQWQGLDVSSGAALGLDSPVSW